MKYTPEPIPRPAGRPASSTPLRDYLEAASHGVDSGYAVLPRSLVESMPLPWQQQMAHLLAEFHSAFDHLSWPVYRVVPSRYERLVDLDEDQLAEVGCLMEIDADGEIVYRHRDGKRIDNPEETTVLVSCLDPIPRGDQGRVEPSASPMHDPAGRALGDQAPTPPSGLPLPPTPPGGFPPGPSTPPGGFGPQGYQGYPPTPERQSW
ncbi:hypothetical protein GCM10010174_20850 [Kutzneria viridogrisea]|uniref:Uncharacterized protein n=2 Tax=Kutzneria TaxID=43356 RepID=W5W0W8_9PSEU|nr:hypothetical protein [Kutzneria albida]AHH94440.1 hypothetical protein KALB_1067 [Kutzneria albida DSM 43870]MBA8930107.1 hypothetical protein [Kutzneria viridogrisea]